MATPSPRMLASPGASAVLNQVAARFEKRKPQKASDELDRVTGSLQERALLVRFSIGRWYGTGTDEDIVAEIKTKHQATGEVGSFTKRFMERKRLERVNSITSEARKYHKTMTLPWGEGGQRLLSIDAFFEYKAKMTSYEQKFNLAVQEFLKEFPRFVESEKGRLRGLFKERDYPSADALAARFRFALLIDPIPQAGDFRVALGEEEVARIKRDFEEQLRLQTKDALAEVWERLASLVSDAKEKFDDPNKGLNRSSLNQLRDLVTLLPKLNVARDPQLTTIADEVTRTLLATDVADIKDVPAARVKVSKQADALLAKMAVFSKGK